MPCFILCLYGLAYLNRAGIEALKYTKDTKFPGGECVPHTHAHTHT